MHHRPLRSALALSMGALLIFAGSAAADTVRADGDILTPQIDAVVDLGQVAPGQILSVDVGFVLACTQLSHVDPGQTVTVTLSSSAAPLDGLILSATPGTVGPVPADWTADGLGCPSPAPMLSTGSPSVVTLRAPTEPGAGYTYAARFARTLSPAGAGDDTAIRLSTVVDFVLEVVANTPPSLILPTVAGTGTVEGNRTGGWSGPWTGLGATDIEDDPDPTADCSPAAGTILPLGTTAVTCSVTDSGGLTASASFDLTVTDTTAPVLIDLPADQTVTTVDPAGATLVHSSPTAADVVDAHPVATCSPASGTPVGLGTTTVACTATDASGNVAQGSFDVTVVYVAPHAASATWGAPIDGSGSTFSANRGRTIPIKVNLFVDGVARSSGLALLKVTPCEGGLVQIFALTFGGGRWNTGLDTTGLASACHTVVATIDGLEAGGFQLDLRGAEPTRTSKAQRTGVTAATPAPTSKAKSATVATATPAPTKTKPAKAADTKNAKPGNGRK